MVRTSAAGIKISAGKSSKKGSSSGGNSSKSSGSSSSASKGGVRLPPIPHQETPSWQKPITNFFQSDSSSLKVTECTRNEDVEEALKGDELKQVNAEETHEVGSDGAQTNLANTQEQRHTETNQNDEENSEGNDQDSNEANSDNKENETDPAKSVNMERHTNGDHKINELNNCNISESLNVNTESDPPPAKKTKIGE